MVHKSVRCALEKSMTKRRLSYFFRFFYRKSLKERNIFEDRKKMSHSEVL